MANILIIEDQKPLRNLYRSVLRQFNHETVFVTTGEAGVEIALRERPDLIILDLLLPGISGTEVAQRLRKLGILPDVPLIITTALNEIDAHSIANSLNATAVLNKPFSVNSILNTVSSALNATSP
ncbi:MAG TPA: response regulator, partial [Dehalococcoidia bacterium]|nr:response regulator [Dehalococcoidia bacterium]